MWSYNKVHFVYLKCIQCLCKCQVNSILSWWLIDWLLLNTVFMSLRCIIWSHLCLYDVLYDHIYVSTMYYMITSMSLRCIIWSHLCLYDVLYDHILIVIWKVHVQFVFRVIFNLIFCYYDANLYILLLFLKRGHRRDIDVII
jgi:hypothetical protein